MFGICPTVTLTVGEHNRRHEIVEQTTAQQTPHGTGEPLSRTVEGVVLRWRRHPHDGPPETSPRRLAAARRAVERDKEQNALTPELVRHQTAEERLAARNAEWAETERDWRQRKARAWLDCRRRLRALPPTTRRGVMIWWNRSHYPPTPEYLAGVLTGVERGRSPWAELRRLRQLYLVGQGRLPRSVGFKAENASLEARAGTTNNERTRK